MCSMSLNCSLALRKDILDPRPILHVAPQDGDFADAPGNFGFDPLSLGSDPATLKWCVCACVAAAVALDHASCSMRVQIHAIR